MSRLFAAVATAGVLLVSALPAFADPPLETPADAVAPPAQDVTSEAAVEEAGEAPLPCANDEGLEVVSLGGTLDEAVTSTIATPAFEGEGETTTSLLVDLAVPSTDTVTAVDVTMTWQRRGNDFDLSASTAAGEQLSEAYQPVDDPVETLRLDVGHCETIELTAVNFMAPNADRDTLTLAFALAPADAVDAPADASEAIEAEAVEATGATEAVDAAEATEEAAATLAQ